MSMSKTRLWVLGTAVLSVLLVVAGYFLLIGPKRAEAADLQQQKEDTQSSNLLLESRIEQLKVDFADLPKRQAELAAIKEAMPEDESLQSLTRELEKRAVDAGVTLMSVAPGEPVLVDPASASAPANAGVAAPAQGSTATPAPTTAPASGDLLVSVPATVIVVGDFSKSELFLKSLQTEMPRAFLVQSLTVQAEKPADASGGKPATLNGDVTMTITGSVFVLRDAGAQAAAAQAAAAQAPAAQAPAAQAPAVIPPAAGGPPATTTN